MDNYRRLKNTLYREKDKLSNLIYNLKVEDDYNRKRLKLLSRYKQVEDDINFFNNNKLGKFFPNHQDYFNALKNVEGYIFTLKNGGAIDVDELKKDLENNFKLFDLDDEGIINQIVDKILVYSDNYQDDVRLLLEEVYKKFYDVLVEMLSSAINDALSKDTQKEIEVLNNKIVIIDQINCMFSNDSLTKEFNYDEFINIFNDDIKSLFTNDEIEELFNKIKFDIEKKEENNNPKVSFDNLEMERFNEEEKTIIEELREIIEDEELKNNDYIFDDVINLNHREELYANASIEDILNDANLLLNHIYDNKEVIKIFKLIISKYRKYNLYIVRKEKALELFRIKHDFNNIIKFVNKNYHNHAYMIESDLRKNIDSIVNEYIPLIEELMNNDFDYDDLENEIDDKIIEYKKIIKNWKRVMSSHYHNNEIIEDDREDTNNLVFCLEDVDLSDDGYKKEFVGSVEALETKSSHDLKKSPGRRGMSRIRKSTENGKERDFVEYLESKRKEKIHFVPYRLSSIADYRTGLIKFEPSAKVKEFLENKYGLSKQSAYYGIFEVISCVGANHNDYAFFESYILSNSDYLEEMAQLFASENPDFDVLTSIIDKMLKTKKNKLEGINTK